MLGLDAQHLVSEALTNVWRKHQGLLKERIQRFRIEMTNRGLVVSTASSQARDRIYKESFEQFAEAAWQEMRRVLEEIGLEFYEGCEADLANTLRTILNQARDADSRSMDQQKIAQGRFHFCCNQATLAALTEVSIFAKKLQNDMQKRQNAAVPMQITILGGQNTRVNVGSTDQSINIVANEKELFTQLRGAVQAQVEDAKLKAQLLAAIEEGEKLPKKTPEFFRWFSNFMQLAAHTTTVVQAYAPALAQLLS